MMRLLFAHANGFVGASYASLFAALTPYTVEYIRCFGEGKYYPQKSPMPLIRQYIDQLERIGTPVVGIGHSMGALIALKAYYMRPEAFSHLILLDPPLFVRTRGVMLGLAQKLGLACYFLKPAQKALRRTSHWPSRQVAYETLREKSFFRSLDPQAMKDYIQHGLRTSPQGGCELVIDKQLERKMFCLTPPCVNLMWVSPICRLQNITIPSFFIYSTQYSLVKRKEIRYIARKLHHTQFIPTPRGHMFPLEAPQEVGELIKQLLNGNTKSAHATNDQI